MIIVSLPKRVVSIVFEHNMIPATPGDPAKNIPPRKHATRATTCTIFTLDKGEEGQEPRVLNKGIAKVHYTDNFCREKGRKIALRRALVPVKDKLERTAIWCAYHKSLLPPTPEEKKEADRVH